MVVGTLEPVTQTPTVEVLEDRLAVLCGYRNALDAQLVALTAEVIETGVWEQSGIVSPAHWLAWKAGLSTAHARQVVRLARRRAGLPETFAAFDAGELSIDQVTPIVAEVPGYADRELCEFAKLATVTQLQRTVRSYGFDPDPTPQPANPQPTQPTQPAEPEPEPDADRADSDDPSDADHPGDADDPGDVVDPVDVADPGPDRQDGSGLVAEWLSLSHLEDGSWRLAGRLDADHGAIVATA
ncbi:MAG: DUF222 domain-containing protein, partial [Ilumatobacteraceae bacterium]